MSFLARTSACLAAGLGLASALLPALAQVVDTRAVPTYESAGLYWSNPGASASAGCGMRFRKIGDAAWTQGLAMAFDARNNQCRGSLVYLTPNTRYEAEMSVPGPPPVTRIVAFQTRANQVPVSRTVAVPSGTGTLSITEGGSATAGYVVYQGAPAAVLDANNAAPFNVTINASYVIVRGLILRGAQQDAIRISPGVTDVVIEDNDIGGWGRQRSVTLGVNLDSGIRAVCTLPTLERVTIQRNKIHDPRYGANSWSEGHPAGPQAITFSHCGGNHVIRHNEIYSAPGRYFNDAIGGEDNFTRGGFPNVDSDIYGNRISHAWDDGIEAEGANENVRIWGNYIDRTAVGIATTVTSTGPVYLFRNVWNRSQFFDRGGLDADERQPFFKSGSDATLGDGWRYVFHNTMLQAIQSGLTFPLGGGAGMGGTGASQPINNTASRNNIYHLWKPAGAFHQTGSRNAIDNDMYSGTPGDTTIVNGINATPTYAPGNGWVSESGGNYQLASGSPGYDQGARIANFNDDFLGAAPDVGAHEGGSPAMKFGIAASSGPAVSGTTPHSLSITPSSLDFGGQSMGTRSPSQRVTVSNIALVVVTVTTVTTGSPFGQTNNCGSLAPGASCAIDVTFAPPPGPGALNSRTTANGSLTIVSGDPGSPRDVSHTGVAEKSLVTHYYRTILGRAPDPGGKSYWESQTARVDELGVNVNEAWYAMATAFYSSPEYASFGRNGAGFVTDLYNTFLSRPPDSGGLSHWTDQLSEGMPREVVLVDFMFSAEFASFTQSIFGNTAARAQVDMVVDFYRGLLARLPDSGGFDDWVRQFRTAQCQGAGAVYNQVETISSAFVNGPEYAGRNRTNAQFVGDLYNAYLRRGGDLGGVRFWINELATGARSRDKVRLDFQSSPEFSSRVNAVIAQGCAP